MVTGPGQCLWGTRGAKDKSPGGGGRVVVIFHSNNDV
eukprot:CAMPEP_0173382248 /NCGR_PEP_ID=MMETSP1356-20130122/4732_1 /TAXON_ID=77927 ORGANISM="Hemiselmis virescens, Strain PCC157" /NCGR_SAMPLE_ID=MMETSP1356 /ASSEMBLY_ACC=CAM_ASM_000847 /LENGTH=36 /DNA_ID= /DNA_START= /DNA_END= /DNA_ORIENTATION=